MLTLAGQVRFYLPEAPGFNPSSPQVRTSVPLKPALSFSSMTINKDSKLFGFGYSTDSRIYFYELSTCHANCATCTGPLETDCLTCAATLKPDCKGTCMTCNAPNKLSMDGSKCVVGGCTTCTSSPTTDCSACAADHILGGGKCVSCNSVPGKIFDGTNCVDCGPNCKTCKSSNPS